MPFSKLKRLLPSRKGWRLFTAKLQARLIRRSTGRKRRHLAKTKPRFWLALSLHSHFKRVEKPTHHRMHLFQKRPIPVYIDDLFKEADSVLNLQPESSKMREKEGSNCTKETRSTEADDMWESLALASPLMYDINERAEEFITRFRAQLNSQESIARRL